MAQQLARQGEQVNLLVLFDTRNPKRAIRSMVLDKEKGTILPDLETPLTESRTERFMRKIKGHFLHWSVLEPKAKVGYIWNQIEIRALHIVIAATVHSYRFLGWRLPDPLLFDYLKKSHIDALVNYVPEVYPGKVTLFRASETLPDNPDHSPLGWEPLAGGGLEIHHFNTTHEMLNAYYSEDVAEKLNECLVKARASAGD